MRIYHIAKRILMDYSIDRAIARRPQSKFRIRELVRILSQRCECTPPRYRPNQPTEFDARVSGTTGIYRFLRQEFTMTITARTRVARALARACVRVFYAGICMIGFVRIGVVSRSTFPCNAINTW